MKFNTLAFATLAVASPIFDSRDSSSLDVQLRRDGNSKIKAVVFNRSNSPINLLKTGSILDTAGVERAQVYSRDEKVAFNGIRVTINPHKLPERAFTSIPAGGSAENEFDIAEFHDLSIGGAYKIQTAGSFQYARDGSTQLSGSIPFRSNAIDAEVDGDEASETYTNYRRRRAEKRSQIGTGCGGERLQMATNALSHCASRAQAAAQAACSGDATKMTEYFKSSTAATRTTVAGVFQKIADECGTTGSGLTRYECTDIDNYCSSGVAAYAELNVGATVYCDTYFETIEPFSAMCHYGDQAGVTIHEMSHLFQIHGTEDYNGYGYEFVQSLSADMNINHADTYMLYANAIQVGC